MAGGRYRLRVLGDGAAEVTTLGGLTVRTGGSVRDVDPATVALLFLPGGNTWATGHEDVLALATDLVARGRTVAAICGATLALARVWLLDDREHTSNAAEFWPSPGMPAPPTTGTSGWWWTGG